MKKLIVSYCKSVNLTEFEGNVIFLERIFAYEVKQNEDNKGKRA